jgi:DNA-binding CsgD family transcriptional regulator
VKNDQEVILTEKPKMVMEPIIIFNGNRHNALSYKIPLRARTGKVIGISGITVLLDAESSSPDHYLLSKRQEECLFLLVRGKTTKEIAQALCLSPRTVESYINEIKIKMSCSSKSQIIEKVFNEEMVNILLKDSKLPAKNEHLHFQIGIGLKYLFYLLE